MRLGRGFGAVAVALTLTACGSSGDAVAWTDKVCGSLLTFVDATKQQPNIDPSDPDAAVQGLSNYLGNVVTAVDSSLASLNTVGPSPVDGGDQLVDKFESTFTSLKTAFQSSRDKLDAIDTSDPAELSTALPAAVAPLQNLSTALAPIQDLKSTPELDAAAKQAPNCQKVEGLTG